MKITSLRDFKTTVVLCFSRLCPCDTQNFTVYILSGNQRRKVEKQGRAGQDWAGSVTAGRNLNFNPPHIAGLSWIQGLRGQAMIISLFPV
jgi:hypothetical protein